MHGADVVVVGQFSAAQDRGPVEGLETSATKSFVQYINPDKKKTIWNSSKSGQHQPHVWLQSYTAAPHTPPSRAHSIKHPTPTSLLTRMTRSKPKTLLNLYRSDVNGSLFLTSKTWRRFFEPALWFARPRWGRSGPWRRRRG